MLLEIVRIIGHSEPQQAFWPLLIAGAAEGYRFYQGQKQKNEAKQFANKPRPTSNVPIPQSVLDNVALAKSSYGVSGLPGQGALENQLDRSVQSGARNLIETGHGSDTAAGIAALENSKMGAIENMGADAAKLKLSKLATLMGANSELGGYEAKNFETNWNWNERDPYLQSMAAASALKNAGEANQFNAISNIATLAGGAIGDYEANDPVSQQRQADHNAGRMKRYNDRYNKRGRENDPENWQDRDISSILGNMQNSGSQGNSGNSSQSSSANSTPFITSATGTGTGTVNNTAAIQQLAAQYGMSYEQLLQLLASQAPH